MALLQEWQKIAYNEQADRAKLQKFWQDYFLVEKGIYEKLLDHPDEEVSVWAAMSATAPAST